MSLISLVPRPVKTAWAESRRFQRFQSKILILMIIFFPPLCRHRLIMLTVVLPSTDSLPIIMNFLRYLCADTVYCPLSTAVHCSLLSRSETKCSFWFFSENLYLMTEILLKSFCSFVTLYVFQNYRTTCHDQKKNKKIIFFYIPAH